MNRFWDDVMKPLLEQIQPKHIVEVGSDNGYHTEKLLDYSQEIGGKVSVIDPFPKYDTKEWEAKYGKTVTFYKELSLSRLGVMNDYDLILLDGDHNWYTIYHELKLIERQCKEVMPYPVIMMHDISWPYARRDLYYNPDNIPVGYRQAYEKKGMLQGKHELVEEGLNSHLNNAIYENNEQNGVLTGIEDYLEQSSLKFKFYQIEGFHGVGIILHESQEALIHFIESHLGEMQKGMSLRIESARIEAHIQIEQFKKKIRLLTKENKQLEKEKEELEKIKEELEQVNNQLEEVNNQLENEKKAHQDTQDQITQLEREKQYLGNELQETVKEKEIVINGQIDQLEKLYAKSLRLEDENLALAESNNTLQEKISDKVKMAERLERRVNQMVLKEQEQSDAHHMRSSLSAEEQANKEKALQMRIKELTRQRDAFRGTADTHLNSARYKIGSVFVDTAKKPHTILKMPYRLAKVYRHSKNKVSDESEIGDTPQIRPKASHPTDREIIKQIDANPNPRQHEMKVSVICWELGHNPLGRAYVLAETLAENYDVELIGSQFERYGKTIWEPLRSQRKIPIKAFPSELFPDYYETLQKIAQSVEGDVIVISKPRLPAIEIAIMAKMIRNRPIILDVDDYELSFFKDRDPLSLEELIAHPLKDLLEPFNNLWTRYSDGLIKYFDHLIVSNTQLQAKYGGTIIPHARDSRVFNPDLYDRVAIRKEMGYSEKDRVILFIGTPRRHKGVFAIAQAVAKMPESNYKLCIVGTILDKPLIKDLEALAADKIKMLPNCDFEALPRLLMLGDLYVIIQDLESETSAYQMPAKFTDALAMGIPILGTAVGPLAKLGEKGLLHIIDEKHLESTIREIFTHYDTYKKRAMANRKIFLADYSTKSVGYQMQEVVSYALAHNPAHIPDAFTQLIMAQEELFNRSFTLSELETRNTKGYDLVFLWKQNDTGLYGRRPDMILEQLKKERHIHGVIHFDAPIDIDQLEENERKAALNQHTHFGLINKETKKAYQEGRMVNGVKSYTYIYKKRGNKRTDYETMDYFEGYVRKMLKANHIGEHYQVMLWNTPINYEFTNWVKWVKPSLIISDVIDDQRAWSSNPSSIDRMTENYTQALNRSDAIFVNCQEMKDRLSGINTYAADKIHVVPNGGERYDPVPVTKPALIASLEGPIIGYVGNLSTRVDCNLIRKCAKTHPEWQIILIGSTHMNEALLELRDYPNIHMVGVVPYREVKDYIRHFDVAIMVHKRVQINEAMNPLKLFVYCAMGKNVVTTDVANIDELRGIVHVAESDADFIEKVAYVLAHNTPFSEEQIQLINSHSWEMRMAMIRQVIFKE